jgi:flavin reductase (DIM6/NTAB) family NADH-FMN oxidoreductase RutF
MPEEEAMTDKKNREKSLQAMPYGLYVVGSMNGNSFTTIIANWVTQVSFNPPLIAIAIEQTSNMKTYIEKSNRFSINILPTGNSELTKAFIKPAQFTGSLHNGKEFTLSKHGVPFLVDANASLECKVVSSYQTGDHITFIGELTDAITRREGDALTLKESGLSYRR